MIAFRQKNRFLTIKTLIQYQITQKKKQRNNNKNTLNVKNLIFVRDKTRDQQKNKKLNIK